MDIRIEVGEAVEQNMKSWKHPRECLLQFDAAQWDTPGRRQ